jgi:hypothetical protein
MYSASFADEEIFHEHVFYACPTLRYGPGSLGQSQSDVVLGALLKVEDVRSICLKCDLISNENSKGPHTL